MGDLIKKIIILALIVFAGYYLYKNVLTPFLKTGGGAAKTFYSTPDIPLPQVQEK